MVKQNHCWIETELKQTPYSLAELETIWAENSDPPQEPGRDKDRKIDTLKKVAAAIVFVWLLGSFGLFVYLLKMIEF